MTFHELTARFVACALVMFAAYAAAWILLEHFWERAWDALDRLRDRIRKAHLTTEYQTVARRHRRTVRT